MTDSDHDPILIEALEWFVRMKDERVTPEQRAAFNAWLSADPAHSAAIERAQVLWDRYGIVEPEFKRLARARTVNRRRVVLGVASALAVLPSAYYFTRPGRFADYVTDIAERRTFTLQDGSEVELGSYSALSVNFTDTQRALTLYRGQGFFHVAPDPARPFVVDAGDGSVQALGTAFDVKLVDGQATVSVLEHTVLVRSGSLSPVSVPQGMQVAYGRRTDLVPTPFDPAKIEAWRRDRLVFEDVPLRMVLKELERYRRGRIVLLDESLGETPVTAVLDTASAADALRIIADTLPIRVLDAGGYVAVVYAR